jgi:inhibitor of cysteine peptidase
MNMLMGDNRNRKMTKLFAIAVGLICALPVVLMVSTSTLAAAPPIIATEAENGKTVAMNQGALLIISLESNLSTGYSWRVSKNDNATLKFIDQSTFPPKTPMPGAPGHQMLKFKAIAPGSDAVELEYLRPWEKGIAPAKTFGVMVTVK